MAKKTKPLDDGATLVYHQYLLDKIASEQLRRPEGSFERVLIYNPADPYNSSVNPSSTDPSASWYLSKEFYDNIFEQIKDAQDFERARDFIAEASIEDETNTRINDFLRNFRESDAKVENRTERGKND